MSAINQVFTDSSVNITGQYLQTNEQIGYMVIDVAVGYSDQALQELIERAICINLLVFHSQSNQMYTERKKLYVSFGICIIDGDFV